MVSLSMDFTAVHDTVILAIRLPRICAEPAHAGPHRDGRLLLERNRASDHCTTPPRRGRLPPKRYTAVVIPSI